MVKEKQSRKLKKEVGMVIESIDNIEVAKRLSDELNLELPILNTVYDILYNNLEPKKAVEMLMTRKKKTRGLIKYKIIILIHNIKKKG